MMTHTPANWREREREREMLVCLCIRIYEGFKVVEKSATIIGKARIGNTIGISLLFHGVIVQIF
jgi:hypothetical protein